MSDEKTREFIEGLQKTGLNYEESLIYLTLIQHGKKGTYVKDLTTHLAIERTTLYSILKRLIEKECVVEAEESDAPKKAKVFVAIEPTKYINKVLSEKKREIEEIEEMKLMLIDRLEGIYQKGMKYSLEDIDPFLRSYMEPLLDKKWQVLTQIAEKGMKSFGYDVYECELRPPEAQLVDKCGFLVAEFPHDIEEDKTTLDFFMGILKRKLRSEVLYQSNFKEIRIREGEIEFFASKYPSFILEVKFPNSSAYNEFGKIAILPIKKRVFSLWAENYQIVQQMVEVILNVEKS